MSSVLKQVAGLQVSLVEKGYTFHVVVYFILHRTAVLTTSDMARVFNKPRQAARQYLERAIINGLIDYTKGNGSTKLEAKFSMGPALRKIVDTYEAP